MLTVRTLHLHRRQLDEVLQETLLHLERNLVKLIKVNQQKLPHSLQYGFLFREHEVIVVAPLQLGRQERLAER